MSLALGFGVVTACGGGNVTSSTTVSEATTTSTSGTTTSTAVGSTTTSSPPSGRGETLLVVGDWGTGTAPEGAVAGAMQRFVEDHDVAAILTTGDNLLSDDAEFIMHPFGWVGEAGLEWWITWGNHDVETSTRIDIVNQTFADPPRWTTLGWGDVQILILDSTQPDSSEQLEYVETALAGSSEPTIVVFHHPALSCLSPDEAQDQNPFVTLFDDDVLLVLNGHEHNYQRFEADGVTYVISGGGGSPVSPIVECAAVGLERIAGEELHHFVALTQDDGELRIRAIDVNGAILDEATLVLD